MATKLSFPNSARLPPVKGQKSNAGKFGMPMNPHTKPVAKGTVTAYNYTGAGPKQTAKITAPGPSVKAPTSAGPAKTNIDPKKVGGLLGNLKVGRVGR